MKTTKEEIKEMEHIEAVEHLSVCKKCQKIANCLLVGQKQEIAKKIEKMKRGVEDISEPEQHCNDEGYNQALEEILNLIENL
jgi:hypothetical protein